MLADHMGHDLNIHTNVYRLQTSLIERAKVARILVAPHSGTIHKFQEILTAFLQASIFTCIVILSNRLVDL